MDYTELMHLIRQGKAVIIAARGSDKHRLLVKLREEFANLKETDMYTEKIILKSISYEETEVIVDYYGDTVYLVFYRKYVPEICRRVKDVYVSLHRYDLEIPKKITAFAKADVYETLTTEYLVAPGKKLIDSFANNGIVIQKIG